MSGLARKQIISGSSQQRLFAERPPPRPPTVQETARFNNHVQRRMWPPLHNAALNDSDDEVNH